MSERLKINPQPSIPIKPVAGKGIKTNRAGAGFSAVLEDVLHGQDRVKFSGHALKRLEQRRLPLMEKDVGKIDAAVKRARLKGVNSSLLIYGDLALIASVKNSTIITVMDKSGMKEHVFTGIDGAVIIE